jgi:aspartate/methionine/tyrosine aminotransferase
MVLALETRHYGDHHHDKKKENATFAFDVLSKVPGLRPIKPSGAMYIMVSVSWHQDCSFLSRKKRRTINEFERKTVSSSSLSSSS